MKNKVSILIILVLGLSFKCFAATGNASDGFEFILVIVGLLLIILGLLQGVDYLKKNGKTILYKSLSSLNKKITLIRNHLNEIKSNYFDISYF